MKIIIPFTYSPLALAPYNRLCGYYRGLKELGAEVSFLVFYNGNAPILSDTPEGIEFIRIAQKSNKFIRHISAYRQIIKTINSRITTGDCIFFYGLRYEFVSYYKKKKGIFVVGEITEKHGSYKSSLIRKILRNFSEININGIDGLFVISHSLRDYYISKNVSPEKVEVINMFVDINRMQNIKIDTSCKYVACCGTVSTQKDGIDTLIQSFSIFHKTYPEYKLKLIGPFINNVDEIYLKDLVDNLELKDFVDFTGVVSPNEIPSLLKNARILALARPKNEQSHYGFPTKLGEYLSTSVPVLVSNVGEIGEFLKDMGNCRMAEPSNVEDFAEKLCWIENHYDEAKELAKKGYELVLSDFSYYVQSAKLYNKIMDLIK